MISVCICTYRRPGMLADLLAQLRLQTLGDTIDAVEIVVIDNDPAHSAQQVLAQWQVPPGFRLIVRHVPEPNIALARNAAVAAASGEWIAFVDDDEVPCTDWLVLLWTCVQKHGADGVCGPVFPVYPPEIPAWIVKGRYFERNRLASGTRITEADARTGNALVRSALLSALPGPFDSAFGRTGGEDSVLFRDMLSRGASFVWCDEAPVHEVVPVDRANMRWLLRRSFRVGQTWIRAELLRMPRRQACLNGARLGMKALAQLFACALLVVLCAPFSRIRAFAWARTGAMQLGKLTGMTRFQYREYAS